MFAVADPTSALMFPIFATASPTLRVALRIFKPKPATLEWPAPGFRAEFLAIGTAGRGCEVCLYLNRWQNAQLETGLKHDLTSERGATCSHSARDLVNALYRHFILPNEAALELIQGHKAARQ
jgi:hypothetical protein